LGLLHQPLGKERQDTVFFEYIIKGHGRSLDVDVGGEHFWSLGEFHVGRRPLWEDVLVGDCGCELLGRDVEFGDVQLTKVYDIVVHGGEHCVPELTGFCVEFLGQQSQVFPACDL
jgi:hypothetical protein